MDTLNSLMSLVGESVPNPAPQAIPGTEGIFDMVIGWIKTGDLVAIAACAFLALILIPGGKFSGNRMVGNIGIGALGFAALGAILYVTVIPILNALLAKGS